jgi:hypothetical protein
MKLIAFPQHSEELSEAYHTRDTSYTSWVTKGRWPSASRT